MAGQIRNRRKGDLDTTVSRLRAENDRLRAAITTAVECMEDYYRTPISARATLKEDIAKVKAALRPVADDLAAEL